jgi:putative transposase
MKIEYHNLYTHFIITTQKRLPLIEEVNRVRIEKFITGVVASHHSKLYAIYANPDHAHLLISRSPHMSEEDLLTILCESAEKFINSNKLCRTVFQWQTSASAFSVSKYILNQPEHHKKVSFEEEYQAFLKHYQQTLKWELKK